MKFNTRRARRLYLLALFILSLFTLIVSTGSAHALGDIAGDAPASATANPTGVRDPDEPVIPETTKVIHRSTLDALASVSDDESVFVFSRGPLELESLAPGDVLVSGVTSADPNGFLRKVTEISTQGDYILIKTEQATLEDAIQKGSAQVHARLTYADVSSTEGSDGISLIETEGDGYGLSIRFEDVVLLDQDGDGSTTDDQIVANGQVDLDSNFTFDFEINDFQLEYLSFINKTEQTTRLELKTDVDLIGIHEEVEILRLYFAPITFWVGTVPVVITPMLTVHVGVDGNVSVGIRTEMTQQTTVLSGVTYEGGVWTPTSEYSSQYETSSPTVFFDASARAYAGPQMDLLLYGVVGPYGGVDDYLELDAEFFPEQWWALYAGLKAQIGVRLELLGRGIVDYHIVLIDEKERIAGSETAPLSPPIFVDVSISHPYRAEIESLYLRGYVAGCSEDPLMFCPEMSMNRAQIAVFVGRGLHGPYWAPPDPEEQLFEDVKVGQSAPWYSKWVAALWGDTFTAGCSAEKRLYCPEATLSRAEGAVFFLRLRHGKDYQPPDPTEQVFVDVPAGENTPWFAKWVNAAYAQGLVLPCEEDPDLRFCPESPLNRGVAAYMMTQAKGFTLP